MTNVTRQVETANLVWVCSSKHMDREWYSTLFHKRLLVCSGQRWLVSFWWLIFDEVKTYDIAKSRPVQVMKEVKESGICALFITVAWTSELLWDRLRLRLLLGALHYIVNYDEILLLIYNRQTKGTNNVGFLKTTEIASTIKKNQTTESNILTQKQLQFIKTVEIHPLLQQHSTCHSFFQPWQLLCLIVRRESDIFERMQNWRIISSCYCPSVTMKRTTEKSLFYVGELLFGGTDWA